MGLFSKQKVLTPGEITPDVLAYWRRKYPDAIFEFAENGKIGYFRELTEKELSRELSLFIQKPRKDSESEKDATDFSFKLIELAMLGGDAEILKNEPFKTSALKQVGDYVLKNINDILPDLEVK